MRNKYDKIRVSKGKQYRSRPDKDWTPKKNIEITNELQKDDQQKEDSDKTL